MKRSNISSIVAAVFAGPSFAAAPSSFDPSSFAQGSFEGEGDTRRFQLPAKEYQAFIVGPFGEEKKSRIRTTDKGHVIFEVVWQPSDPEVQSMHKLEKLPTVRQSIFLDLTEDGRGLDMAPFKNADLNKLRTVFGLNGAGVKWSFQDFMGKPAKIKVEQRPNPANPAEPFSNVTEVKAS